MNEKPEALRLADDLRARIEYRPSRDSTQTLLTCDDAARCLEEQHAENERLREALAWAYNLRHLRGHSDPVVIPERFAPLIEAALRRKETT